MKILNSAVSADLAVEKKLKIDVGGGKSPKPGYFSLDISASVDPDILADIGEPLDQLPTNSVSAIYSRHTLEHIRSLDVFMQEMHRVVCPDGLIEIIVPHFSNAYAFSDPTHVRFFGLYSMYYFSPTSLQPKRKVPNYYYKTTYKVIEIKIEFYRQTAFDRLLGGALEKVVNSSFSLQEFYERRLAYIYHAWQLRFVLQPIK